MKPLKVFNEEGQITQFKTKRYKAKTPEELYRLYTSIVATIYPADKKDFRLNPYRVFGVNGAEPRYR